MWTGKGTMNCLPELHGIQRKARRLLPNCLSAQPGRIRLPDSPAGCCEALRGININF